MSEQTETRVDHCPTCGSAVTIHHGGGEMMQGERVPDVENPHEPHPQLEPGQYRRQKSEEWGWVWHCRPPGQPESCQGNLRNHEVTEHEDGTITVSPSILIRTTWAGEPVEWHGYLECGTWREV